MSLLKYFEKTSAPLTVSTRSKSLPIRKKRPVGRPRKKRLTQSPEADLAGIPAPEKTSAPQALTSKSRPVGRPRKRMFTQSPDPAAESREKVTPQASKESATHHGPVKVRRTMYTSSQKAKVACYTRLHGPRAAGRHFCIHHKNAQRWLKEDYDKVKITRRSKCKNKKGQGRKVSYPLDVEEALYKWVLEKREVDNVPIAAFALRTKALSLIKPILPNFKASDGWLRGFLVRFNLLMQARTSIAQMLPSDLESKVCNFRQEVKFVRQNGDFDYAYIANMDETPVYMDMVPSKTIDKKEKKFITVCTTKSEKCRVTAVLACTATGDMLPPMIVFKGTTTRSIRGVASNDAVISYQKKAWVDEEQMLKWIKEVWVEYTKKAPSLLFHDTFSAHLTDAVKESFRQCNTTVVLIPGGLTSILQPLDVGINKPVKGHLRLSWVEYMLQNVSVITGNPSKPSKQHVVDWIVEANTILDSNKSIVKKSFLVTGLSNALGGHEDVLIRNDVVRREIDEEIVEVFGEETMRYEESHHLDSDCDQFDSLDDETGDPDSNTTDIIVPPAPDSPSSIFEPSSSRMACSSMASSSMASSSMPSSSMPSSSMPSSSMASSSMASSSMPYSSMPSSSMPSSSMPSSSMPSSILISSDEVDTTTGSDFSGPEIEPISDAANSLAKNTFTYIM